MVNELFQAYCTVAQQPTTAARGDAFARLVIESGGTMIPPDAGRGGTRSGSHLYELSLGGVVGRAPDTIDAALDDWIAAARRTLRESTELREAEELVLSLPSCARTSRLAQAAQMVSVLSHDQDALDSAARIIRMLGCGAAA